MTSRLYIFVFLMCVCALSVSAAPRQSSVADGYAALVNNRMITISDVLVLMQPVEPQLRELYEGAELEQKLKEAFDAGRNSLIERALILEDFEKKGAQIPERMVDGQVETIIEERFDNDRGAFLEALAHDRMTLEEWREQVKERLIIMFARRQVLSGNIYISPAAVQEVYVQREDQYRNPEEVKLRMIIVYKGETEEDHAVKYELAESILAKLKDGAEFGEVARELSEGSRAKDGGDWGWMAIKDLRPEFTDTLRILEPGAPGDILDVEDAYYILNIEGRKEERVVPLPSVKEEIEKELRHAEEERLYREWIDRLRKKYTVKIF